jgi:hypothetical protein
MNNAQPAAATDSRFATKTAQETKASSFATREQAPNREVIAPEVRRCSSLTRFATITAR